MNLSEIPRVRTITKDQFVKNYVKKQKPLVVERLTEDWPAYQKWNLDYIYKIAGNKEVPLYDDRPVNHKEGFNEPHAKMNMGDYIDLLKKGPTNYRIFLYNLMNEVPVLQKDFEFPDIGLRLVKSFPMLFFGGENSKVFMHFDIDYSNILHFQFNGKKRCVLFGPDQTDKLYKIPHSIIAREDIDFDRPDFERFPALKGTKGYVTEMEHGNMLYMPEGYWHYMKYLTPGFSMSLRSLPKSSKHRVKAVYNLMFMRYFDVMMRKWRGQSWIDHKNEQAVLRTHRLNGISV